MGLTEKAIEAGVDAALKAREEGDKRRKITDEAALRVVVRVECEVQGLVFSPPLDIFVNGVRKAEGLNMDPDRKWNERDLWLTVGVDADGVRPVAIRLVPVDGAEVYFKAGASSPMRLEAAFYRNEIEKSGRLFTDPELRRPETVPHVVRVAVKAKRGGFFKARSVTAIPSKWQR
jgi:hypothetical protein